jgi:hypothetical protein
MMRHCEERSDAAIHGGTSAATGLPRSARNDKSETVIARSEATRQSMVEQAQQLDCHAPLAMTNQKPSLRGAKRRGNPWWSKHSNWIATLRSQ